MPFHTNFLESRHSLSHHRNYWVVNRPSVASVIRAELVSSICEIHYRFLFKKINNFIDAIVVYSRIRKIRNLKCLPFITKRNSSAPSLPVPHNSSRLFFTPKRLSRAQKTDESFYLNFVRLAPLKLCWIRMY